MGRFARFFYLTLFLGFSFAHPAYAHHGYAAYDMTQTVTVNGDAAPLLDTETANLGGEVRASEFQSLASFGRDPFQLLQLAPGAFGDGAQSAGGGTTNLPSSSMGGSGGTDGIFKIENGGQISANGARAGENN